MKNTMRKNTIFSLCLMLIVQHCLAQSDTILTRYKQYLTTNLKVPPNSRQLAATLNSNGQWSDINYRDNEKSNWQPLIHLKRVRDLALAWSDQRSSFYQQNATFQASSLALDHWLEKRYKCPNWWHNEIGVPQQMRDIIILLKTKLSPQQLKGALEVFAQYKANTNLTGANLSWSADLGIHYGALTGDLELIRKNRDLVIQEIRITTRDGVQPDYSFHQHDKRLQMYQYGEAFLSQNIRLAHH
ncbi:MAG: hypothetical protein EON98_06260 [Chitinophagaceae bacterium]|nr:MAG: hypothetical protein EON98_06260 [Chitinophagaceae bacterium]